MPSGDVRPHPKRADWYLVPLLWAPKIVGAPHVYLDGGRLAVHRSHLPLLGVQLPLTCADPALAAEQFDHSTELLGWKLRPYQHQARQFIRARRGTLVADTMRTGKAQPLDAQVLTPQGWRRIGDLAVGDEIVDPDGGTALVQAVFPQGVKDLFRVELCDGAATECCDDHLWAISNPDDRHLNHSPSVLPLKYFREHLWQQTPTRSWGRGNRRCFVPLTEPVEFARSASLPIDPYLLGALLGNGNLSRGSICYTGSDLETIERIQSALPHPVRMLQHGKNGIEYRLSVERSGPAPVNPLLAAVSALGLRGKLSYDKFIPEVYLRAPATDRLRLLQGLMDTDGDASFGSSKRQCTVSYNTTSPRLRDGVMELIRSLGGFASISGPHRKTFPYKGQKKLGAPTWRLHIRMPVNPFLLPRKADRWRLGYMARGIESVTPAGKKECVCISVSSKRGLYITDDYIVTHNTATAVSSVDLSDGLVLVVAPLSTRGVWANWFARRWPDITPRFLKGKLYDPSVLDGERVVFCHYDVLMSWMHLGDRKIAWLILDEAHLLCNRKSKRAQAALYLSTLADRVIALTGTPVWNRPADVWTILSCCNPSAWGKYHEFACRYGGPQETAYGTVYKGSSNEDEFRARLSEVMIRRTWQDLVADLPPITRAIRTVDLTERQLYQVETEAERVRDAAARVTPVGALARFRRLLASVKLQAAVDEVKNILDEGETHLVVWVWHKDFAEKLAEQLPGFVWTITGDTAPGRRDFTIGDWSYNKGVLVISLLVGQVGIDLSAARHAVFAEIDWTPSVIAQAEMRTFSQDRPMTATYLIIDHEIERSLLAAIHEKCEVAQKLGLPAADTGVSAIGKALQIEDPNALAHLAEAVLAEHPDEVEDESQFWRDS